MPDQDIFCNSPWHELHIYWDGGMGFCCIASHRMYPDSAREIFNIKNITINEWFDSPPMRSARLAMLGHQKNSFCDRCYHEEKNSGTSRRHNCNQKSVIFTKGNFQQSYQQSPGHQKFEYSQQNNGAFKGMPIDLHIDLGNHCNLTCKMCAPQASSKIAAQHVKWGIDSAKKFIGTDWTRDESTWHKTLDELSSIKSLRNIHFMGGETLITPRFHDFVDYMIAKKRFNVNLSFVTNGTVFDESLMQKLLKFQRIGIEVSIETITDHNAYQRQGTDTAKVLQNIDRYLNLCDGDLITVTARPAISLLTIGNFYTLLSYCLDKKIMIKSLLCTTPRYYSVEILPKEVKKLYLIRYEKFNQEHGLDFLDHSYDFNEKDIAEIPRIIKMQSDLCINLLNSDTPKDADLHLREMVDWSRRWDSVHGYDARVLYPEFKDIYDRFGY
jgi:hypothetical protein